MVLDAPTTRRGLRAFLSPLFELLLYRTNHVPHLNETHGLFDVIGAQTVENNAQQRVFADQKKLVAWKNGMEAVLVEWKFGICRIVMDDLYGLP